jgi:hypothetical protein
MRTEDEEPDDAEQTEEEEFDNDPNEDDFEEDVKDVQREHGKKTNKRMRDLSKKPQLKKEPEKNFKVFIAGFVLFSLMFLFVLWLVTSTVNNPIPL